MTIREQFESQPWANALSYRKDTVGFMIEHFQKAAALGLTQIIETGTARARGDAYLRAQIAVSHKICKT